jgi:2-(1,2-epoxy-1,2-dihydrophenyl)acetyl-CoA isomerase
LAFENLLYTVQGSVAIVTLNRAESMNALNSGLRSELVTAFEDAFRDTRVRVVLLNASGKGFSSGTDLPELSTGPDIFNLLEQEYKPVFSTIMAGSKPVIAAVQGPCAGIGASLVLACDLAIMGESAFIYLAFANIGLIPDGGMSWLLARNIGYKRAFEIIAECARLPAPEALELGLVNRVVADSGLQKDAVAWAEQIAQAAPLSLKYAKQALQQSMHQSFNDVFKLEASLQTLCFASQDSKEGIAAFFEKRKPIFEGK